MKDKACRICEWYLPPNIVGSRKEKDLAEHMAKQEVLPSGFCVRYPPIKGMSFDSLRAGWVIVQEDDYCGEFAEKQ